MQDLDEIYRLYADDVYRFLYRLCRSHDIAEELTAETFYRAVKNIDSYNGNCKMTVWLCHIGKNLYFDLLRRKDRSNVPLDDTEPDNGSDMAEAFEDKETSLKIHKILHTLEEPYKEVFSLRVFSELSFKDIGSLFGKSDGWARTVFFRAKEKILKEMEF